MKKLIITLILALPFVVNAQVIKKPKSLNNLAGYDGIRLGNVRGGKSDSIYVDSNRVKVNGIPAATLPDVKKGIADSLKNKYFPLATTSDFYNAGTSQNPILGLANSQASPVPRSISAPTTVSTTDKIIVVTSGTFTQPLSSGMNVEFYNKGTGTVTITYNGVTIKKLSPGTANSPDFLKFTWNPNDNTYLTH